MAQDAPDSSRARTAEDESLVREANFALDSALDELVRAGLANRMPDSEQAYWFKHALIQDTAYATLLKDERQRLHARVAQTLETSFANQLDELASPLAQHYARAGDGPKTFLFGVRAADLAVRRYGYDEARTMYALALEALARLPDTPDNQRRHVDTVLRQMRVTRLALDPLENLERLGHAESIIHSLLAGPRGDPQDRFRLARIYYWLGTIHLMRTELVEADTSLEMAIEAARQLNDPRLAARAYSVRLGIMTMRGDLAHLVPLLTQELERYEKAGNRFEWVYILAMLSYAHAGQGYSELALAEGERAIAEARELNNETRLLEVMGTVVGIYLMSGDIPKFLEHSRETLAAAERLGERVYLFLYVQRALASSRLGNSKAALAELQRAKAGKLGDTGDQFIADWLVAAEAEIALSAGQPDLAAHLAERAVAIAHRAQTYFGGGYAERVWGLALLRHAPPDYDRAQEHFAESLRFYQQGDLRLEAARTRVVWGEILMQQGERSRALEHLEQAAAQFRLSGIAPELEHAERLKQSLSA